MLTRTWLRTGVATVVLAGSAIAAVETMPAATAATPECGSICMALSDQASGRGDVTSVAVSGLDRRNQVTTIVLAGAGPNSSEDFFRQYEGTVAEFYTLGLVSAAMDQTWPNDSVYEYQYAPGGHGSGKCIAVPSTAAAGTVLTLGTCGSTAAVVWVALAADNINAYEPLINGTDSVVNTPYVMTANGVDGALTTEQLSLVDGTLNPQQMWQDVNGVLSQPGCFRSSTPPRCTPGR
jgi:hypothetical protein